ncbi:MAG: tryptophanase [Phycisphaerales bacterium]|nr:tryptophanase [Phycisphaerales bacterium]NNM25588.1 tryptophanase [Phycisphaerales bacterium]
MKTIIEPFRIKTVEPLRLTTISERRDQLRRAGYNLFRVPARHVLIDLLTDSGTGAMSSEQWAGVMRGDESYAGADSYYRFLRTVRSVTGFDHVLPTHQGRASERILVETLIGSPPAGCGKVIPGNAHFDTTRANIEHAGAEAIDLLTEDGRTAVSAAPFKGNLDTKRLRALLERRPGDVPAVMLTVTCNTNGGQPVAFRNVQRVRAICDEFGVPLILDAARFAENAWFIKTREPGQAARSVREIARSVFELADGATISAKKDGLVNIGGVLLLRDEEMFQRASDLLILTEGFVTYGGLAGRDLEAMAIGIDEALDEDYLRYRVRSIEYLGQKLAEAGVRIVQPPGGHAIYIDAAAFCPHIPAAEFPGQALACALYEHAGIRACEIGSVMLGEHAVLELVRLAIPRRTYTQSHIDYVIEAVLEVKHRAEELVGFRLAESSGSLRHFTARFEPVSRERTATA